MRSYPAPLSRGRISESVLAMRPHPSFRHGKPRIVCLRKIRGGRAPIGACSQCPHRHRCGSAPCLRRPSLRGRQSGALAFRRSTAVLAKDFTPWLGSGSAFPGITGCKREDPPRRQCSELLADRSHAPADRFPSRPGADCKSTHGHRSRSMFRCASRTRPLSERDAAP
jgi:hypothetical protein